MKNDEMITCTSCGGPGWYETPAGERVDCVRCSGLGSIPDESGSLGPNGERVPNGFRPRKLRPEGWWEQALADGTVKDINASDPDEGKDYSDATVVNPPTAIVERKG